MKRLFQKLIPFELKRGTSWLSIIIALIITGLITELGKLILIGLINLISLAYSTFGEQITRVLTKTYEVNLITLVVGAIVFIILLFPIYRKVDKFVLTGFKNELIFKEDFSNPVSWRLNHWGSNNQSKTNRIENNKMIFEATPDELQNTDKFFGANYDLKNGIYSDNYYEVSCHVKSSEGTTMKFQLWLHDTKGGDSSVFEPKIPSTPSVNGETISIRFLANNNNAIRIHLHCQGGAGRIEVDFVSVYKIK